MNRWIRTAVVSGSIIGSLALVGGGVALAQQPSADAAAQPDQPHPHHHHPLGLLGQALRLDSLTPAQRTSVQGLIEKRRVATVPVRAAHAQVLTALAQQVDQASVDTSALAPTLSAEEAAATAESTVAKSTLGDLHDLLTPSQRSELVDQLESAHHGHGDGGMREMRRGMHAEAEKLGLTEAQKSQIGANLHASAPADAGQHFAQVRGEMRQALESFRGTSFDPAALARVEHRGEWAEKLTQAVVPVLTPAQRATLAGDLRARAARETQAPHS